MTTERTRLHRLPARGSHEHDAVHAVLDEAMTGHLAFVHDATPFAVPTIHARIDDTLYVHGSVASRMLRSVVGETVCYTVTLIDGLVVARSGFNHSMNYRSAMLFAVPRLVDEDDEKATALDAIVDHILPGRSREVRANTAVELRSTRVLAMAIDEFSVKTRAGDPHDDDEDLAGDAWAGVVPMSITYGAPYASGDLRSGLENTPASVLTRAGI